MNRNNFRLNKTFKKSAKAFFSFFVCLSLIIGSLPASVFSAYAGSDGLIQTFSITSENLVDSIDFEDLTSEYQEIFPEVKKGNVYKTDLKTYANEDEVVFLLTNKEVKEKFSEIRIDTYSTGIIPLSYSCFESSSDAFEYAVSSFAETSSDAQRFQGDYYTFTDENGYGNTAVMISLSDVMTLADENHQYEEDGLWLDVNVDDSQTYYTGQNAIIDITFGNKNDEFVEDYVIRVYVYIEGDGHLNYSVGESTFDGIAVTISEVYNNSEEGVLYCIEINGEEIVPGDTRDINIFVTYDKYVTSGGNVYVIGDIADVGSDESWPDDEDYDEISFITVAGDVSVEKTAISDGDFAISGINSDTLCVNGLIYTISTSIADNGLGTEIGKDYVTDVAFTDTLTLPDNTQWNEAILEAISSNDYRVDISRITDSGSSSSSYYYYRFYATVDDEEYLVLTLRCPYDSNCHPKTYALLVDEDGQLIITWTNKNSSDSSEISIGDYQITFGDNLIEVVDSSLLSENENLVFSNAITEDINFNHSEAVQKTDEADNIKEITDGNIVMEKTLDGYASSNNSAHYLYPGISDEYVISVSNTEALPYSDLRYIEDELNQYLYLTGEQIDSLFEDDSLAGDLTVTIQNASIGTTVSKTVTAADGTEAAITQQTTGTDTDYNGKEITEDSSLISSAATITFTKNADGNIVMTVSDTNSENDKIGTYTIGESGCDYTSVQNALDGIGYFVTYAAAYNLTWDLGEDFVLYGGQTIEYAYEATPKDTFMLLLGDQDSEYTSSDYITGSSSVKANTALAKDNDEQQLKSISTVSSRIYKDFELYKNIVSITKTDDNVSENTQVSYGDIITYTARISHIGGSYDALPLVDKMTSGQYLLVPVSLNPDLTASYELETIEYDGIEYYILSENGTYKNVVIEEGIIADTIEVSDSETLIYYYLNIDESTSDQSFSITYNTIVRPKNSGSVYLSNQIWLNDHETHRLYDSTGIYASVLSMDKSIVTDIGNEADPADDKLTNITSVAEDENVLYRFTIKTSGDKEITVTGNDIYDMLPKNVSGNPWTEDDITVQFIAMDDVILSDKTEDIETLMEEWSEGWYITSQNPDEAGIGYTDSDIQQFICWNSELSISYTGTIYVYVTLQFPSGENWKNYSEIYINEILENTLRIFQLYDTVYHNLSIVSTAYLQKGVYLSGLNWANTFYDAPSDDEYWYYTNDLGSNQYTHGGIEYFITVYNDGPNDLYLNDIQDILPAGFTHCTYSNCAPGSLTTNTTIVTSDGKSVTCKSFSVDYTEKTLDNGRQLLTFKLYNGSSSNNLNYSDVYDKYYLEPGEAAVIRYYVYTNKYDDSEDIADNVVGMPFFDYTGGGVTVSESINTEWKTTKNYNNGDCYVQESDWAENLGMTVDNETDKWLTSDVKVYRDNFIPGITKTANNSVVNSSEDILWTITLYNEGPSPMIYYTITDVMEFPYSFKGDVTLVSHPYDGYNWSSQSISSKLFTIGEHSTLQDQEYVSITANNKTYSIPFNSEVPTEISTVNSIKLDVALYLDENNNEVLSIHIKEDPSDYTLLLPGGYATLELTTVPNELYYSNAIYYNTCYITPDQEFDSYEVTTGSYTSEDDYVDSPSVRNQARVTTTYGHYTLSDKTVSEADNENNTADSEAAATSDTYITLSNALSQFKYTLEIQNGDSNSINEVPISYLVIIDNLPEKNDIYTFENGGERESAFKVSLADDPKFTVWIETDEGEFVRNLTEKDYVIQYSTKSTGFTSEDWAGTPGDDWADTITDDTRSFRIIFTFSSGYLEYGQKVLVSFIAEIDDANVEPGDIAWNSFGYSYTTSNGMTFEAAPMKVGVSVPTVPILIKELQDLNGNNVNAGKSMTFSYIIYKGSDTFTWETEQELILALTQAGIESYTKASVTVDKGSSSSGEVDLSDLVKYSTSAGTEETEAWTWEDGETYTVVEIPSDNEYVFSSWNTTTRSNAYTFTYDQHKTVVLRNTNEANIWSLEIEKTDENGDPLEGAVFELTTVSDSDKAPYITETGIYLYNDNGEYTDVTNSSFSSVNIGDALVLTAECCNISQINSYEIVNAINDENFELSLVMGIYLDDYSSPLSEDEYALSEDNTVLTFNLSDSSLGKMDKLYIVYVIYVKTSEANDEKLSDLLSAGVIKAKDTSVTVTLTGTSDSEGKLTFTGLTEGTYALTEITAPDGYKVPETPITITISYDSEAGNYAVTDIQPLSTEDYTFEDNVLKLGIENEKDGFSVDIYKYTDNDTPLENTGFTLSDENGSSAVFAYEDDVYTFSEWTEESGTTLTTKKDGFIHLKELPAGTYYLSETKTPDGYMPLSEPVEIVIDKNGNVTYDGAEADTVDEIPVVKVYNKRGSSLPNAGGVGTLPFIVSGSALISAAAFALYKKKKKRV